MNGLWEWFTVTGRQGGAGIETGQVGPFVTNRGSRGEGSKVSQAVAVNLGIFFFSMHGFYHS